MTANLKKILAGGLAVLTLAITISATATPASAQWGWGFGAGLLGGAVIGSALAARPYYYYPPYAYGPGYGPAYYPGYPGCYWQRRPSYDAYGHVIGYHPVRVCY